MPRIKKKSAQQQHNYYLVRKSERLMSWREQEAARLTAKGIDVSQINWPKYEALLAQKRREKNKKKKLIEKKKEQERLERENIRRQKEDERKAKREKKERIREWKKINDDYFQMLFTPADEADSQDSIPAKEQKVEKSSEKSGEEVLASLRSLLPMDSVMDEEEVSAEKKSGDEECGPSSPVISLSDDSDASDHEDDHLDLIEQHSDHEDTDASFYDIIQKSKISPKKTESVACVSEPPESEPSQNIDNEDLTNKIKHNTPAADTNISTEIKDKDEPENILNEMGKKDDKINISSTEKDSENQSHLNSGDGVDSEGPNEKKEAKLESDESSNAETNQTQELSKTTSETAEEKTEKMEKTESKDSNCVDDSENLKEKEINGTEVSKSDLIVQDDDSSGYGLVIQDAFSCSTVPLNQLHSLRPAAEARKESSSARDDVVISSESEDDDLIVVSVKKGTKKLKSYRRVILRPAMMGPGQQNVVLPNPPSFPSKNMPPGAVRPTMLVRNIGNCRAPRIQGAFSPMPTNANSNRIIRATGPVRQTSNVGNSKDCNLPRTLGTVVFNTGIPSIPERNKGAEVWKVNSSGTGITLQEATHILSDSE